MKGLSILLIVGGAGLGVYGFSYDGGSAVQGAAILCVALGVVLFFVSAFVESKKKDVMSQMSQMQAFTAGTQVPMDTQMAAVSAQMNNPNLQKMMGMDAMSVLKSVMDAQQQSNGDPEAMAKMLQEKFGGQSVVVNGDTQTKFSMTGEVLGSLSSSNPSNDMLNQLIKLRDSGAISNEQFEEQKDRLIDS